MNVIAYLAPEDSGAFTNSGRLDTKPSYFACLALAQSLGVPLPRHTPEAGGQPYLTNDMLRAGPPSHFDGLEPGDVVLFARFADLGDRAASILRQLNRLGVRAYAGDIGPSTPLVSLEPIVAAMDAAYAPLKARVKELQTELAAERDHWRKLHAETVEEIVKGAVPRALAMIASMPVLGERMTNGHAAPEHVGAICKEERERQGLSQAQLARRIDVPQSAISKFEAGEVNGAVRDRALRYLFAPEGRDKHATPGEVGEMLAAAAEAKAAAAEQPQA